MTTDLNVLLRAAGLMRDRAEAATPGPWYGVTGPGGYPNVVRTGNGQNAGLPILFDDEHRIGGAHYLRGADAHHIAAWHPAVAVAVADWLEAIAAEKWCCDECKYDPENDNPGPTGALAVARAYLGQQDGAFDD